jgi:pimeloyl-ACP methyl ester carboxylesterase
MKASKNTPSDKNGHNQENGYVVVNGVTMYYESYGKASSAVPLIMLHGGFHTIAASFSELIPKLSKKHQVIALEMQGHGHTADVADRPLTYQQLADDVAVFMDKRGITKADFLGWSMGGNLAAEIALRHPDVVNKTIVIDANYKSLEESYEPEAYQGYLGPGFAPQARKDEFEAVAPYPEQWDQIVHKLRSLDMDNRWPTDEQIAAIQTPFLIMLGDRDGIRLSHEVDWYRLMPNAGLAVIPYADHFAVQKRPQDVFTIAERFLKGFEPES